MPSGGARTRSGPPADPNSGRSESGRNAKDGWTVLPLKPAITRAPKWPLDLLSAPEKALWAKLWRKPQATMWRRLGLEFQVAAYARVYLEATDLGSSGSLKTVVLRMEDTLGISPAGLAALRWRISADEVAAARADATPAATEEKAPPVRRLRGVPAA